MNYRPFVHPGGEWRISAWRLMWHRIGQFRYQDWERNQPSIFFLRILESVVPEGCVCETSNH